MKLLEGKTAIITGASRGIGKGIALTFAKHGANIAFTYLSSDKKAKALEEELSAFGIKAKGFKSDASKFKAAQELSDKVIENFDSIDVLVNNAGITHTPKRMEDISEEEFDRIFSVNSKSVFLSAKYLVPLMTSYGGGNILNIASTAGISPRPNLSWYNASKGWMISATKAMAIELASKKIRVNALAPVAGETPLLKSFMGGDTPEKREKFLSTIPIGRFSTPDDMGNAACFLCSDEASMITGVILEVDGGRCI